MRELSRIVNDLDTTEMGSVAQRIVDKINQNPPTLGRDYRKWDQAIRTLGSALGESGISPSNFGPIVTVGAEPLDSRARTALLEALQLLKPWRKGPYRIADIDIDSEWRSDLKWARLGSWVNHLEGRNVLDIGCGNGYFGWRMLEAGAACIIGLDPTLRYVMQHELIKTFSPASPNYVLPLRFPCLPELQGCVDLAFSMGVLYHQRDPLAHLQALHQTLIKGGELILETLVIEESEGDVLRPAPRYARMKNVWAIPSLETLQSWLGSSGFSNIKILDVSVTTSAEQRATPWSSDQSLVDFLDPLDQSKTVEGYPAPRRAMIFAIRN